MGSDAATLHQGVGAFLTGSKVKIPNFMVFGPESGWQSVGEVLAIGFLGNDWRYCGDLLYL